MYLDAGTDLSLLLPVKENYKATQHIKTFYTTVCFRLYGSSLGKNPQDPHDSLQVLKGLKSMQDWGKGGGVSRLIAENTFTNDSRFKTDLIAVDFQGMFFS